jgi:nitrite reductase/ring-hydroxylating ferredoxin subunit
VLLARRNGRVLALADTCTHMGCSLAGGRLEEDEVVCPCHGSRFRLDDGQVARGPATTPEPVYEVRVRDGRIEVRQPVSAYGGDSVR